jgi:Tfp pilus assembly protein PilN
MSNEQTVDWGKKARDFIVGKVDRQVPRWVPTALFINKIHEFDDTNISPARRKELLTEEVTRSSPLGEEHTRWSYLVFAKQKKYFLFMTDARKVQQVIADQEETGNDMFWYPGVLALCGKVAQPEWKFLLEENCVTAALFTPEQETPQKIVSRFYRGVGFSRSWHDVYADLRKSLSKEEAPLTSICRLKESFIWEDGSRMELIHEMWNEDLGDWEQTASSIVAGDWLISANLRVLSLLEQRKIEDAKFNRYAWWGLLLVAVSLLLLGCMWMGVWWRQGSNKRMAALIQEQREQVKEIEKSNEGLLFLRGLMGERGNVLDWMTVINANRPESIVFEAFQMTGDKLEIRGSARQPREVTTFREQIDKTGEFKKINLDTKGSGSDGTRFTLGLELKRAKPVWEAPVETSAPTSTSETTEGNGGESHTVSGPESTPESNHESESNTGGVE